MKKGVLISLFILIALMSYAFAQQDEFSVRFHSFGKNATIDLKQYLGESEQYLASQTKNVIVNINQETGIATLIAREGWEGSEVVFFRANETFKKLDDEEEIAKFLPAVPEILYLRKIREEELARLFEGTLDPSILNLIKDIRKEEIKKISTEIKERSTRIRINDEVDLKLESGYIPSISIDFSLGEVKESEQAKLEEEKWLKLNMSGIIIIAILAVLIIIGVYFYRRTTIIKDVERKDQEIEDNITKDIKQLSINKLQRLQKELENEGSSEKFIYILREFFSRYFGIGYNFEFRNLQRRVNESDVSGHMKKEIKDFINEVLTLIYYPTEKWAGVYGERKVLKKDLKKLIIKMKSIIRRV